jgi:ABC-type oligopeptide transport system ATPase subunit
MPLVEVCDLTKHYGDVAAVERVTFAIEEGETFGLVGESGSGKSTTGRCLLRLIEPTSGEVRFRGENVLALDRVRLRQIRREMQMVFQDPFSSLNPRMRVGDIVREPLDIHGIGSRAERRRRVEELFDLVGLDAAHLERLPDAFSGGQRQRIGLARALALSPSFIVADEPVSALDMSIQAQVVDLLMDLQRRLQLTYLFIAHDLRLVQQICTRAAVMYRGRIVEWGTTARLFGAPQHPYTRALLSAVPRLDPDAPRSRVPFDAAATDLTLPLRQVDKDHFAAV